MLVAVAELQHVPIDRHQQRGYSVVGGMLGRHGRDLQTGLTLLHQLGLPGVERVTMREANRPKLAHGIGGGDDRQILAQVPRRDVIEVIAVIMRQYDQIDRRQVSDLAGGFDLAPGPHAVTQVHMDPLVQERRIGQDRNAAKANHRCGITDEVDLTLREVGRLAFRKSQYSHRARPCSVCGRIPQLPGDTSSTTSRAHCSRR